MAEESKTQIEDGIVSDVINYDPKSNHEIRELALACRSGTVFGSWMMHESDLSLMGSVFMPIMFLDDINRKALQRNEIVHFYGYLSDAAPRSINGMPMFFKVHYLNRSDCDRLSKAMKALDAFMSEDDA